MNVASFFDGMSCGQIALNRIGVPVEEYYASEIDKYAIKVTKANFPNTKHMGDINNWREWDIDWSSIDLVIGGSPCQGFSFAGKQLAFDDPRSKLFFVFLDIVNYCKSLNPNVKFMLENVKMKKEYLDVISELLGVEPIFINSSLVSAQNRQRWYWTNIERVTLPEDRGIVLRDILDDDSFVDRSKSYCLDANYFKGTNLEQYFKKSRRQIVFKKEPENEISWRKLSPLECERLQTVPENYTNHVSNTQRYKMLGNGWTVDVIAHIFKNIKKSSE